MCDLLLLGPAFDQVQRPLSVSRTSCSFRCGWAGREKSSRPWMVVSIRSISSRIRPTRPAATTASPPRLAACCSSSLTDVSGLRISWATPAARPPIAASRSVRSTSLAGGRSSSPVPAQAIDDQLHLLLDRHQLVAAADLHGAQIAGRLQQRVVQRDLNACHASLKRVAVHQPKAMPQCGHERDGQAAGPQNHLADLRPPLVVMRAAGRR